MATTTRPYIVAAKDGTMRLIQATHPAQALRHAARNQFAVQVATANDVLELISKGVKPEVASEEAVQTSLVLVEMSE